MSNRIDDWIQVAHPLKQDMTNHQFSTDICNIYEDAQQQVLNFFNRTTENLVLFHQQRKNTSRLVPCENFEHQPIYTSIITQFGLYCSRDILVATTQFFHLFGVLCGGIVTTNMLKYIEPRRVMLIGMFTVKYLLIKIAQHC